MPPVSEKRFDSLLLPPSRFFWFVSVTSMAYGLGRRPAAVLLTRGCVPALCCLQARARLLQLRVGARARWAAAAMELAADIVTPVMGRKLGRWRRVHNMRVAADSKWTQAERTDGEHCTLWSHLAVAGRCEVSAASKHDRGDGDVAVPSRMFSTTAPMGWRRKTRRARRAIAAKREYGVAIAPCLMLFFHWPAPGFTQTAPRQLQAKLASSWPDGLRFYPIFECFLP